MVGSEKNKQNKTKDFQPFAFLLIQLHQLRMQLFCHPVLYQIYQIKNILGEIHYK